MFKLRALPRTLAAAERDLAHATAKVRLSAMRDLARFDEEPERARAIELARQGLRDTDVQVRAEAALRLADLRATECVADVVRLLGDVQLRVRQMALVSLGELAEPGNTEVVGSVGAFLGVSEAALRFQALSAWARLRPDGLAVVLAERVTDADPEVRALALRLAQEHWVDVAKPLPESLVAAATERLMDEAPGVRLLAAVLLGRAGASTSSQILIDAVARRRGVTEPIDEQDAIELCGALGLQQAVPALSRRAFGRWGRSRDPFALQAKAALALLGDERAQSSILSGLSARSWHVRAISAEAAASARLVEALPHIEALRSDPKVDRELVERAISTLRSLPPGTA